MAHTNKLSKALSCAALTLAASPVLADTVWLKNGDRLTGEIKVFDGGKLVLQTSYGGTIPLDWKQVKTLESDRELMVKQDDITGERAKSLKAAEDGKVTLVNGEAPKTIELASIEQLIKPKPLVEDLVWKGNIDLGLDYKRADKDTDDYDVDFKTTARHGAWRHNAEGGYNREMQDDVTTTNNWNAEYALDRFLDEHWFWQGRLSYKRDHIEDVSSQRTIGTGPGYQFWDDELGAFSLGSLLNRTDYEYSGGKKDNFYSLAMKWDYNRYLMGKTVSFFTNGELGKSLEGESDYSLDSEIGERVNFSDKTT